ncbi:MAG: hypothetical protein DRQ02_12420 [Candidatus Latescibacterota bacterium]|nr:MAG: hypothetical protein DRQ02_12420 [Candidatus Latescibacterota bacterium]
MYVYRYILKALDFIYFARKTLVGDITPPYIHATAINAAIQSALNLRKDDRYVTFNEPNYNTLFSNSFFYATPARPSNVSYINQGITANQEKYVFSVEKGEILRFQPIKIFTPLSEWKGFIISTKELNFKKLKIRLGRGKSLAEITVSLKGVAEDIKSGRIALSHTGDPLNMKIVRGIMINTMPYPLVENPTIEGSYIEIDNLFIGLPHFLL